LPQDKTLTSTVKAYKPDIFVNFSLWIGRLRRIAGFVRHLDKLALQNELITPFHFSIAELSVGGASPTAQQKLKRSPKNLTNCCRTARETPFSAGIYKKGLHSC